MSVLLLRVAYALLQLKWRLLRPITIGVRLAAIQDGQVLLVRHTYHAGWHFPGGGMNRGETPLQAAQREAYEEAGIVCDQPPRLQGIDSSFVGGKNDHVALYVATKFRVQEAPDRWEIAEVCWFAVDALPEDVASGLRRQVREIVAGLAHERG